MPHRNRLPVDRDLVDLREHALRMASLSEAILEKSLEAVWGLDSGLAAEVKQDDIEIDRLDVEIDTAVLEILALDAPVAIDLRHVIAIKSVATDLERVGDLARNIASCARRLASLPDPGFPEELRSLAELSGAALRDSIRALEDLDATLARRVLESDDEIDDLEDKVIRSSIQRLTAEPDRTDQEIDLIFISQSLERVGDHATNIAEEVILAAEARNLKHSKKLAGS